MPSNYTGNAFATQVPGPTPSLNGAPIGALPTNGDTWDASAWMQSFKECLDWIHFLSVMQNLGGVNLWDGGREYSGGQMVVDISDGNTYQVKLAHSSTVGVHPASDLTNWNLWALNSIQVEGVIAAQVPSLLPTASVLTTSSGITLGGVGANVSNVLCVSTGYSPIAKRLTFQMLIGSAGLATIVLSGDKAFPTGALTVQVTPRGDLTSDAQPVSASIVDVNTIHLTGYWSAGNYVYVTIEGY